MNLAIQLIAPGIAALAAVIAAAMSMRASRLVQRNIATEREIEFRRQQLNELYGPIHMKQATSVSLRRMLPGIQEDGSKWRLVDHIEDVKASGDTDLINCVGEILRINEEIAEALTSKSALYVSFPPPQTLSRYIAHVRLLSLAWRQGHNESQETRLPFPDDFDKVIEEAVLAIRLRLAELRALPKDVQGSIPSAHIPAPWAITEQLEES
jgi:hypothetical protein